MTRTDEMKTQALNAIADVLGSLTGKTNTSGWSEWRVYFADLLRSEMTPEAITKLWERVEELQKLN